MLNEMEQCCQISAMAAPWHIKVADFLTTTSV